MKYNKKIEEYNSLIDKGNKRINSRIYIIGIIIRIISIALAWTWFDWKLALIFILFAIEIDLERKYQNHEDTKRNKHIN